MARVRVSRVIEADPSDLWPIVADLQGHAAWQVDVRAIDVTSSQAAGVGTTYLVHAQLGLLRMRIPMEVVEWDDGRSIAVRYDGSLSGGGRISLKRRRRGRTKVTWAARVRLPLWLGGPVGAFVSAQMLRFVWRRNLANLSRSCRSSARLP
jgi:hypothetical protein